MLTSSASAHLEAVVDKEVSEGMVEVAPVVADRMVLVGVALLSEIQANVQALNIQGTLHSRHFTFKALYIQDTLHSRYFTFKALYIQGTLHHPFLYISHILVTIFPYETFQDNSENSYRMIINMPYSSLSTLNQSS